ncbi:MAG: methyltransferase domain-containing protein [Acetobacterium sp.]
MNSLNTQIYEKFEANRIQPVKDLINRIDFEPKRIIDIGCGPGNSTIELRKRWPNAEIMGLDHSPSMIAMAKNEKNVNNNIEWVISDETDNIEKLGMFDLIFSNAALQWMPKQAQVFQNFLRQLNEKGVMAIHIPMFVELPIPGRQSQINNRDDWVPDFHDFDHGYQHHSIGYYYNALANFGLLDFWQTNYYHIIPNYNVIIDMLSSTELCYYLEKISEIQKKLFINEQLEAILDCYGHQSDGSVLFPFKRLFFIVKLI